MSKNSFDSSSNNDELDLLEFFRRTGKTLSKWFRALGTGSLIVIVFLIRSSIPLVLSVILGVGLSYLMKWTSKPVYLSEITLRSNAIPNADMISYFNKLSVLIRQKNFSQLSSSLSLSPENASKIRKIDAYWVIDKNKDQIPDYIDKKNKFNVYDTLNQRLQDRFVVDVITSDPKLFKEISQGLVNYPERNSFFSNINNLRLRNTDELLTRLTYDIKQLDSLQKVKYFEETRNRIPESGGQMVFLQEQKTQLVYDDIYDLYQRKQSLNEKKEVFKDVVTILADFYEPLRRYNGGTYYGKVIIPSILGLMLIYLIAMKNRKKIKDIYNKY